MGGQHLKKYFQKYQFIIGVTMSGLIIYSCSTTRKVPEGEYLFTRNNFKYEDSRQYASEIEDVVLQKPNKKALYLFPLGLWIYNLSNPKYDTLFREYMTYPREARNQQLRDSLFIKYGHPEAVGQSMLKERVVHTLGTPPVILDQTKTKAGAENIRRRLVYHGFWDADVKFSHTLDSAARKGQANFFIRHNDSTLIDGYYYNIPDPNIKKIYEQDLTKSTIRSRQILDQANLENEVRRINEMMREKGYYRFNASGREIYFTADTLRSTKRVPLVMDIHKDSLDTPYKIATVGDIKVVVVDRLQDTLQVKRDSLWGINFYKQDNYFKTRALWRPILLEKGQQYQQKYFDLTRRNIVATNNFNILRYREGLRKDSDSIIDVTYYLAPLDKFDLKIAADANYSQLLSFSVSPSVDLISRNIFGGAENLSTSLSWILGRVRNAREEDTRMWAYEISAQANLMIPRLLLPFASHKLIPKRYSPTTTLNLGASFQKNIGMDRLSFNGGLNYLANVNDVVSHRLTLANTQLSLTRNKERYYEYFPRDKNYRDIVFTMYSPALAAQVEAGILPSDQLAQQIVNDQNFTSALSGQALSNYNSFRQSLLNKDRQTQDVVVSSLIYNFTYNEIGKKEYLHPFYFNGKLEVAGNLLSFLAKPTQNPGVLSTGKKDLFGLPLSQFIKIDADVRKHFRFGTNTLVLRQFIGVGIPYGSSVIMPFIKSYFNGGSNDIRAWNIFGGLGPADSQLDERIRAYAMDNVKLTTNIEFRIPFSKTYEGAIFTDMGNIWSLRDTGFEDQFKFSKFYKQMGIGSGVGLRINIAYITARIDAAYKIYDPNVPQNERWRFSKFQFLKPTLNFAIGYPF